MSRGKWKNPPREKPRVRAPKFPEDSMSRVTRLTSGEEFVLLGGEGDNGESADPYER